MKKCIFCQKGENDFDRNNCFTEEHIIPKALGNEILKIDNVCKNCNSGLGMYVDNYFVNHIILKIIRQYFGLRGQSGKIPIAFEELKDENGNLVRLDEKNNITLVPHVKKNGDITIFQASSKEEIRKMVQNKCHNINMKESEMKEILEKVEQTDFQVYSPKELKYSFSIDFNRFFMEALKIAFEYAIYILGNDYLMDLRAIEIQHYLKNAIDGKMKEKCLNFVGVDFIHSNIQKTLQFVKFKNYHMILIRSDSENRLIADVILFLESMISFSVLISLDANKYSSSKKIFYKIIIPIKKING